MLYVLEDTLRCDICKVGGHIVGNNVIELTQLWDALGARELLVTCGRSVILTEDKKVGTLLQYRPREHRIQGLHVYLATLERHDCVSQNTALGHPLAQFLQEIASNTRASPTSKTTVAHEAWWPA